MINHFTTADADRLLGFADQFIEDWETDEGADLDADERERIDEYRQIRPLLATAPHLLQALQNVEVLIQLELKAEPGSSLHRALQDIQAAIAETAPLPLAATAEGKRQQLVDQVMSHLLASAQIALPLAEAITDDMIQFFYDPDRAIADVWGIEDIQLVRPDLNEEQALQVLRYIEAHNDSKSGLCWSSLELWADDLFPMAESGACR
jgi:hypothetical protein